LTSFPNRTPASSPKALLHEAFLLHQRGQLEQAAATCQRILLQEPQQPDALHLLGLIAHQQGNPQAAVDFIARATKVAPTQSTFHYNLGGMLKDLGELDLAANSYRRVLSLTPDPEALNNLGIVLRRQGKMADAIDCYKKALALKPEFAEAHYNLGNSLLTLRELDDAEACFRQALLIAPNFQNAHSNLGEVFLAQGKLDEAIGSHLRALQMGMGQETRTAFAQCIKNVTFTRSDSEIYSLVARAIEEAWILPGELSATALSLIRLNEDLSACIDRANAAWPDPMQEVELFGTNGAKVAAHDRLLLALLENAPVIDLEIERFLTLARRLFLEKTMGEKPNALWDADRLRFFGALAQQCFFNEYVFAQTAHETDLVQSLMGRVTSKAHAGIAIIESEIVAIASYCSLGDLPVAASLLTFPSSETVGRLLRQQVKDSMEESAFKATIPSLTEIGSGVSRAVQDLYEKNPYPRWTGTPVANRSYSVDAFFQLHFPTSPMRPTGLSKGVDILIAGCGTGQHSIGTATRFQQARVLAIDLSKTSLGYAKRKSAELGLTSIDYAQADILRLGRLDRTFDIVESVGVLHHLADPMAGWRVLLGLLRPGGLMRLGFYSELARRAVVAARSHITTNNYGSSVTEIRQCRQDLMSPENIDRFQQLKSIGDFYQTSGCRDLIFHVQEHRFTLRQLKTLIEELQLEFVGFELEATVTRNYLSQFPGDLSLTNLDNWHRFEIDNPDTFANMYQFWVQKGCAIS
jgi:Flp pilus assembly protein TadD/2-polyprenyl-3-methyl-5-hydroxy-6-metoxy-1,4-benzoquinol methylase